MNGRKKPYKVKPSEAGTAMKSYRFDVELVRAIESKAAELGWDQTQLVETILALSLGVREVSKPLKVVPISIVEKIAA